MIYLCPKCGVGFTLPIGDYMREKELSCPCGVESKHFPIGEIDSIPHRHKSGKRKKIHSTLYEIL